MVKEDERGSLKRMADSSSYIHQLIPDSNPPNRIMTPVITSGSRGPVKLNSIRNTIELMNSSVCLVKTY